MAPLLPALVARARDLLSTHIGARSGDDDLGSLGGLGPLRARAALLGRDSSADSAGDTDPSVGVIQPGDINNTFVFVLFGLIGAALVCVMIWFFFWARNGGFYFREDDWSEYKSTVLRRRGPNGTVLTGATPSTRLGGGSVYKDVDDDDEHSTEYTGGLTQHVAGGGRRGKKKGDAQTEDTRSTFTGITGGVSDFLGREKRRQRREKRDREREKRRDREQRGEKDHHDRHRPSRRRVGEDGALVDEEAEADAQSHLRAYRHEKPARVGGLNRAADGSEWEGSTNPATSTVLTAGSESQLLANRQSTPTATPEKKNKTKKRDESSTRKKKRDESSSRKEKKDRHHHHHHDGNKSDRETTTRTTPTATGTSGIRKVYSTADRTAHREDERLRAEARRLAERGRGGTGTAASSYSYASDGGSGDVRRNYSFQRVERGPTSEREQSRRRQRSRDHHRGAAIAEDEVESMISGSGVSSSDLGTKSYHHPIPGLAPAAATTAPESYDAPSSYLGGGGSGGGAPSTIAPSSSASNLGPGGYADERRRNRAARGYRRGD
ncbi:hypothetical protein GGR56DRAFT_682574 [Xylariaceae sp. FL0804]|nr:hypothetical protein GGR56DRAFT_682574 [Xylariaceae sp. FL0804]